MKHKKKTILTIAFILIILINSIGERGIGLEELNLPSSIGNDIVEQSKDEVMYSIPLRVYFSESKLPNQSQVITSKASSIGETRDTRQLISNKDFILGLEESTIMSEQFARFGVRPLIDILLNNPYVNDNAKLVVCNGKAQDILDYQTKHFDGKEEYIGLLIEHSYNYNFFPKKYTLMDFIMESSEEGKNPVVPYIDIVENKLKITGLAIFDKTKMITKLGMEDVKILNLLRENKGKGMLTIQKNSKKYINYYPRAKRKVKCYKEGSKYKFVINIYLKGPIVSNQLYKNLNNDPKVLRQFQNDMEKSVEKKCNNFINKIKTTSQVDMLNLGNIAAAKYGRRTGVDWNKKILDSEIKVNVKVKVHSEGRGDYLNKE
ncbi:Ger(x)C family spore germination protein [Clostridium sp. Marseille-Q2269]|uniref:Ger(x)C family spore germination protein n=1 Tax=Clostridium sp. Marseille-Q2269 TaxID=2942205 RepID=UPI0020731D00|nr:Ger(x)C family spore germination protein [Clostridium sp. Marseille-Q2269]